MVLPADPEEDAEEVIAVPAVAAPLAPAPVVINMEDVGVVPPPVEEAPHTGAEIMIVQRIERIVPVEGNIEDFDYKDDDFNIEEDYENDDYNIIQERTKVEVSSGTNKSESKDSEVSLENSKQEEARQEEEVKVVASIKEAAEASIAEAVRVEAAEVVEMQNAVKQDEEMIGAIYNPIHDITQMSCNIISHRMFSRAVVAAGDEDEKVLDKSLWIAGTYGTNTQKGFAGYKGHAVGGTIGFDIGSDNYKDLVGIAYTKLDSKFNGKY
ncbi:autotransporter outer membrane beta-barrel domain-containing protein [Rickettsia sp. Tenjiku01]|uniref:autotransporter outer membrane beta-barrel domain-containing protein n=1 Tax=Rickettsia sp. Tenjiku01 TaxID=1736693 RepID=UPI001D11EFCF|nr:autotransporter outer membrane beta-barrel domain-containing protein [Rickettsia sp. Tenjiku01]